uniref:Serine/arginine repetitive matrix 3 n=1 Tax=Catharus ustulatus TaxID=91951 RepID=A0A8C3U4I3_CATUS
IMALYNNGADVPSPQEASNGFPQPSASGTWHKGEEEVRLVEPSMVKKAHREILDHERKRRVELKCMELQEMMEEQGYSEEEIRQKVGTFRQMLMEKEGVLTREDQHGRQMPASASPSPRAHGRTEPPSPRSRGSRHGARSPRSPSPERAKHGHRHRSRSASPPSRHRGQSKGRPPGPREPPPPPLSPAGYSSDSEGSAGSRPYHPAAGSDRNHGAHGKALRNGAGLGCSRDGKRDGKGTGTGMAMMGIRMVIGKEWDAVPGWQPGITASHRMQDPKQMKTLYSQGCSPVKSTCHVDVPYGNLGSWLLWGHPSSQDELRGGAGICLQRVKERHHRGRPNSSSESSAKHSRHASERRKSPSRSPGQRSSSWSSSGSLSKSRSRSREKRAARSRSRSPSPKKPASREKDNEPRTRHGDPDPARPRRRSRSYSPIRKRRRDSPSFMEPRRITRWVWHVAKALPWPLPHPGAELCCQLTPKGVGVDGNRHVHNHISPALQKLVSPSWDPIASGS